MPIPIFVAVGAGLSALTGGIAALYGSSQHREAKRITGEAQNLHNQNVRRYEREQRVAVRAMDNLGRLELNIVKSFSRFSTVFARIHNRPQFEEIHPGGAAANLPRFTPQELQKVSSDADMLLGTISGAVVGVAGGYAAAGLTTSAVAAFGTAGTGTAISTLSGAAATNAIYAAIGGSVTAGTTLLGAATGGIALMIGGLIVASSGRKTFARAEDTMTAVMTEKLTVDRLCRYLSELERTAHSYQDTLHRLNRLYSQLLSRLSAITTFKQDWDTFTPQEQQYTENLVKLVTVLYAMCKVNLVVQTKDPNGINRVNTCAVEKNQKAGEALIKQLNQTKNSFSLSRNKTNAVKKNQGAGEVLLRQLQ